MNLAPDRVDYTTSSIKDALRKGSLDAIKNGRKPDVIIVGAGPTGCLAAKCMTDAGLDVLLLDAGLPRWVQLRRLIWHAGNTLLGAGAVKLLGRRQSVQSRCFAWWTAPDTFVDDVDNPYVTPANQSFVWLRSRQLGGRIAVPGHGRQYYRLGPADFHPSDGASLPWPLGPNELSRWYDFVEQQVELAGNEDGLDYLPNGRPMRVLAYSAAETRLRAAVITRWPGARPILSRFGIFNMLDSAAQSGRLRIRSGAVATSMDVDEAGCVSAVRWTDRLSGTRQVSESKLVFLCASALESTRILMLSRTPWSAGGIGSSSGALGHFLMDHIRVVANGYGPPIARNSPVEAGRCLYIPRFDAREHGKPPPARGFGVQIGQAFVDHDRSQVSMASFGEMLPRHENFARLHPTRRDAWGVPILEICARHGDVDLAQAGRQKAALRELADATGVTLTNIDDAAAIPGSANHECGTARMGSDPKSSVLDPHNECWEARGLFVTDGASMPSQGSQNPVLTLLALTARACDYALHGRQISHPVRQSDEDHTVSRTHEIGAQ